MRKGVNRSYVHVAREYFGVNHCDPNPAEGLLMGSEKGCGDLYIGCREDCVMLPTALPHMGNRKHEQ